jgi:hypothetical protein
MFDVRFKKCSKLNKSCDFVNNRSFDVVVVAYNKQIFLVMYDLFNALLLQRRTIYVLVTTINAASINVQFASFKISTQIWIKFVEINIRKKRKMRFHHQSIELKLEVRQVQTSQINIMTIYVFVEILKDHFFMSMLFLLSSETLDSRSTRRESSASR